MHKMFKAKKTKVQAHMTECLSNSLCSRSQAIALLVRRSELHRLDCVRPLALRNGAIIFYLGSIQPLRYKETFAI